MEKVVGNFYIFGFRLIGNFRKKKNFLIRRNTMYEILKKKR